jgi:S1-C subfamily serine protease
MKPRHAAIVLAGLTLYLGGSLSAVTAATPGAARRLGTDIADAVEKVMPAVVVIRTRETQLRVAHDRFFGHYEIPEDLAGQGSGMIITKDGYVLTNNHVVDSADEIEVVNQDGMVYPAKLVGRDYNTDLAVLKIQDDQEFSNVEFVDSDTLRAGEFVVAIGSPFSLQSTVTLGIISQLGRVFGPMPFVDYIQTDASINRGNSGGPLIDVDGKVAGVNTFIQTAGPYSAGSVGIGFAVPANLAKKVSDSIIQTGESQLPWIGIAMQPETSGVRVMQVADEGPAFKGGLRAADILTEVGGTSVRTTMDVKKAVQKSTVGAGLDIKCLRGEDELNLVVIPDAIPDPWGIHR